MADVQLLSESVDAAPKEYELPAGQELVLKSCFADFDGSAATVAWLPTLEIVSDSGHVAASIPMDESVAAGASVEGTFAPFLDGRKSRVGAWCVVYRDTSQGDPAYVVAGAGINQLIPFRHFHTSDESVFGTNNAFGGPPNNQPDDFVLLCRKPGAYVFENGATWVANFNFEAFVGISVQTFRGPNWDHPANLFNNTTGAPLFADKTYFDARVYAFAAGEVPANVVLQVAQQSGANQNLKQSWLRVAYFPTADTFTQVYG